MNPIVTFVRKVPLIEQIAVGLVIGILLAVFVPAAVPFVSIFGDLFVSALKGVAPVLVFILVMNAMIQRKSGGNTKMKPIVTDTYDFPTLVGEGYVYVDTLNMELL